ncbi:MAG: hypothetical protein ACE5GL_09225 [Calditrichia bacterium]
MSRRTVEKQFSIPRGLWTSASLKIIILFFGTTLIFPPFSLAQTGNKIEFVPFYGWQFGGNFSSEEGKINIKDTENFGLIFNFVVPGRNGMRAEMFYSHQNTRMEVSPDPAKNTFTITDMSVEYYQAGATYEEMHARFGPFVSFTVGATRFHPKEPGISDAWRLSAGIGLGAKLFITKNFGLRIQSRLLAPIQFNEGSLFCEDGVCLITLKGGTAIIQGDVIAGLIISL